MCQSRAFSAFTLPEESASALSSCLLRLQEGKGLSSANFANGLLYCCRELAASTGGEEFNKEMAAK